MINLTRRLIKSTLFFWASLSTWCSRPTSQLQNLKRFRKIALCSRNLYLPNPVRIFTRCWRDTTWKVWSGDLKVAIDRVRLVVWWDCLPFCIFCSFSSHNSREDGSFWEGVNFISTQSRAKFTRTSLLLSSLILVVF
jgi:hypothetical protein